MIYFSDTLQKIGQWTNSLTCQSHVLAASRLNTFGSFQCWFTNISMSTFFSIMLFISPSHNRTSGHARQPLCLSAVCCVLCAGKLQTVGVTERHRERERERERKTEKERGREREGGWWQAGIRFPITATINQPLIPLNPGETIWVSAFCHTHTHTHIHTHTHTLIHTHPVYQTNPSPCLLWCSPWWY